jgi:competence protein ComEC
MPGSTFSLPLIAVAFLSGMLALLWMPSLADARLLLFICAFVYGLTVLSSRSVCCIMLAALSGMGWAYNAASHHAGMILPLQLASENVLVRGHVEGLAQDDGRAVRFNFLVREQVNSSHPRIAGRIRVSDYRETKQNVRPGEAWQLMLRVKPPHGFANMAGFDFEKWLFSQRVTATAYIRESPENRRLPDLDRTALIDRLRARLAAHLATLLPTSSGRGLVNALATGDRRYISPQQWSVLQVTGTSHLMAISGLHVGLVAALVFLFARRFWSLFPALAERLPAYKFAALCALAVSCLYSLLAGFSIPTRRALLMLAIMSLLVFLQRRARFTDVLSLTVLLVLLFDPLSVLSSGFWLSFGAVVFILFIITQRIHGDSGLRQRLNRAISLQWKLGLLMFPLTLWYFQNMPVSGPFANLLAIPLVAFVVVPLVLLASFLFIISGPGVIEAALYKFADLVISFLWHTLAWFADVSGQLSWAVPASGAAITALGLAVIFLLLPGGLGTRKLAFAAVLAFIVPAGTSMQNGEYRVYLLDVGQGLATLVTTRNHALLFDAGPRFSSRFDAGSAVVIPTLRKLSVSRLDSMIISHGDNDHIGGMTSLLEAVEVGDVISNEKTRLTGVQPCIDGTEWQWDGVRFNILHPLDTGVSTNDRSCVLRVSSAYGSILFPADIEKRGEAEILTRHHDKIRSDVLVAPHHGSNTSLTEDFLDSVSPSAVLFPAGWMNRYRHPGRLVMERIARAGITSRVTGDCGALTVRFSAGGISIESQRDSGSGIWVYRDSDKACRKLMIGLSENPPV